MPWQPHLVDAGVVFLVLCFRSAQVVYAQPSEFSQKNEVAGLSNETMFKILECWNPCANGFTGNESEFVCSDQLYTSCSKLVQNLAYAFQLNFPSFMCTLFNDHSYTIH